MFCKKELKNFTNYAGKHLVTRPATLLKRDSNTSIFLWNLQNFQEHLFWRIAANDCFCSFFLMAPIMESLLNKVASLQACNFIKKRTPTQVFSCGVCKVFKNTYFEEYLRTTAFVVSFSWLCAHYLRHRFINQKKKKKNAKTRVHIFTKIKNKDPWKQKKIYFFFS